MNNVLTQPTTMYSSERSSNSRSSTIEAKKDLEPLTSTGSFVFNPEDAKDTANGVALESFLKKQNKNPDGQTAVQVMDPDLTHAIHLYGEAHAKLEIAREQWGQAFAQVARVEPQVNDITSITDEPVKEEPQAQLTKSEIVQSAQDTQPDTLDKVLGVTGKSLILLENVVQEGFYLTFAGLAKILRKDHDQFVYAWGERLGLTSYFMRYLSPSFLDSSNPA